MRSVLVNCDPVEQLGLYLWDPAGELSRLADLSLAGLSDRLLFQFLFSKQPSLKPPISRHAPLHHHPKCLQYVPPTSPQPQTLLAPKLTSPRPPQRGLTNPAPKVKASPLATLPASHWHRPRCCCCPPPMLSGPPPPRAGSSLQCSKRITDGICPSSRQILLLRSVWEGIQQD